MREDEVTNILIADDKFRLLTQDISEMIKHYIHSKNTITPKPTYIRIKQQ